TAMGNRARNPWSRPESSDQCGTAMSALSVPAVSVPALSVALGPVAGGLASSDSVHNSSSRRSVEAPDKLSGSPSGVKSSSISGGESGIGPVMGPSGGLQRNE